MNRIKLVLAFVAAGAVSSASAQLLEFTNLTLSTSPNLFHGLTNQLNAVAYGGNSNFVAVGVNQIYVCGNFQPGQTWITNSDWVASPILPADKLDFTGVAASGNLFVATGTSNDIFSAANAFTPAGLSWSQKAKVFNNTVLGAAIAYNGGGFATVCEAPAIGWSSANLPISGNWITGTLTNIDFAESFRGVTAYGANGFAACGIFADVRLSANGTNWQAAVSGHIGLPDLYAIAYDGAQTLVGVGATNSSGSDNGVIMASVNNAGTNWQTVYVNNAANTPINAVAYTGSGFIAVGNKGQVLTSPNGIAWTVQTSPANVNLYGVAFANSGYMTGVAELVGASGTVILAGTPPPLPINPVGETNCSTFPNPPVYTGLSVTLVSDANHPAGTVTADWYDALGNLVASGTTNFVPTNNPDLTGVNAASNIVFYAQERDLRTGFVNTNRTAVTLQIIPRPTATLTTPDTTVCNEGSSFTLTNILTGIGPWTVIWNDGTTQTASQIGPGPVILTRSVIPTNTFANMASNNVYYVTIVTNADMCMGNVAGDIIGINTIIVDPRPTASLTPLSTVTCNEGDSYTLTNTLNGLGPWTVIWNDTTVQTTNTVSGFGPATLVRTVYPTNSFGANTPSNNVYSVTVVSNADMCEGNQSGDITGTASIVVYPRPTATLAPLVTNVCNTGNSYTLTGTLTGIGPFTVHWNDGTAQGYAPGAPISRPVFPTNTLPDAPFTNSYYITNVVDNAFGCVGDQPGDLTGTNLIIVNPLPTATLTISTNDFAVTTNGASTGLLEAVSNPSGTTYNLTAGFQYLQNGTPINIGSQTLNVTNHLAFTGIAPWTVVLSDGSRTATNTFGGPGSYVWQETISTNTDTNFTFSVQSVQSTNTGCSGAPTNIYDVLVYDAPTAAAYTTNIFCGSATNIATISAALGGFGPWTNVVWSDGFTNSLVTTGPVSRTVPAPTNNTLSQIVSNYTIVSLTDKYGATTTSSNDLAGVASFIVDPFVALAPGVPVLTNYNCPNVAAILSVAVPTNFTADWFADAGLTTSLATGTTNFDAIITNAPGTNVYYVTMRYNDAFSLTNCSPGVATNIYLVSVPCVGPISLSGTNVILSWTWNGSNVLQSTTNLLPPVMWMNIYTGALGPNFLTNAVSQPPIDFFRLYTPTN